MLVCDCLVYQLQRGRKDSRVNDTEGAAIVQVVSAEHCMCGVYIAIKRGHSGGMQLRAHFDCAILGPCPTPHDLT